MVRLNSFTLCTTATILTAFGWVLHPKAINMKPNEAFITNFLLFLTGAGAFTVAPILVVDGWCFLASANLSIDFKKFFWALDCLNFVSKEPWVPHIFSLLHSLQNRVNCVFTNFIL